MAAICGALVPYRDDVEHVGLAVGDAVGCDLGKARNLDNFVGFLTRDRVSRVVCHGATSGLIWQFDQTSLAREIWPR